MTEDSLRCPGMRDLLPADMERFRKVEAAFRSSCLAWGYQEIRTPTIEHLYLFTGAGTLSPQMLGRVYSFLDWDGWSGERVVLRPDATIPAARLYIESLEHGTTAKLFYVQNVFRFAQGDDSREDWQCGVELIGDTAPAGDIELILLALDALRSLAERPMTVRLSHPGIIRAVLAKAGFENGEQLQLYDRLLDGDASVLREVEARLPATRAALEMLGLEGEGSAYLNNLSAALAPTIPELARALGELLVITQTLEALNYQPLVSAALVRNFEYYTGPVFQFALDGETFGGGGRYDSLMEQVGGEGPVAASGFALSAQRLMQLLPEVEVPERLSISVEPRSKGTSDLAEAFATAAELRSRGLPAQIAGPATGSTLAFGESGYLLRQPDGSFVEASDLESVLREFRQDA
ncbi:MAG TPA: ATP phosphoribosyltransferase regulatory subunit [Dehalococcoidia bacterium]|nr:ATP phosphoribosyltransferase regulatory subunit [Dehalococcoidia bacterium]